MSVAAIANGNLSRLLPDSSLLDALAQAWRSLEESLNTSSLQAAQTALRVFQQIGQAVAGTGSGISAASPEAAAAFQALATALGSGDLAGAQHALAQLPRNLSTVALAVLLRTASAPERGLGQPVDDWVELSGANPASSLIPDLAMQALANAYGLQNALHSQALQAELARREALTPKRPMRMVIVGDEDAADEEADNETERDAEDETDQREDDAQEQPDQESDVVYLQERALPSAPEPLLLPHATD